MHSVCADLDFIFKSALPIDINFIWLNIFDMNCITKSYIVSKLNGGNNREIDKGGEIFSQLRGEMK